MVQARAVRQEPISAHKRAGGHGIIHRLGLRRLSISLVPVIRRFDTCRAPLGINSAGGTATPHALHGRLCDSAALVWLDWSAALSGCAIHTIRARPRR